jgi:hypothetical protein
VQTSWGVGAELQEQGRTSRIGGADGLNSLVDSYRPAARPRLDRYYPDGGKMEGRDSMFKTISRIFDKSGLDPQSNPCGSGGPVALADLDARLRERHRGAQAQTEGRQLSLGDRLPQGGQLGKFDGGDR